MSNCDWCGTPGVPYEYNGAEFSGLCSYEGEQLCPKCRDRKLNDHLNQPVGWAQVPASQYILPVAYRYR